MKKVIFAVFAVLGLLCAAPSFAQEEAEATNPVSVSRAVFTSGIERKEPIDEFTELNLAAAAAPQNIYLFSEVLGMAGRSVKHVWKRDGVEFYEHTFKVAGPRWRVNSSVKTAQLSMGETLSVSVVDDNDVVIRESSIKVTGAGTEDKKEPAAGGKNSDSAEEEKIEEEEVSE